MKIMFAIITNKRPEILLVYHSTSFKLLLNYKDTMPACVMLDKQVIYTVNLSFIKGFGWTVNWLENCTQSRRVNIKNVLEA